MNKVLLIVLIPIVALALTFNVNASDENCKPINGGGKNCIATNKLKLDKKIQIPQGSGFADNLGDDQKFKANETLNFKITITNDTRSSVKNIEVKDILPKELTYVSGPGKFDAKTKTLTFSLSELKSKESKKYIIVTMANQIAKNACSVNYAYAQSSDAKADDNSKFCIEKSTAETAFPGTTQPTTKGGLPVMPAPGLKQTPSTGPEMLPLFGLIPAGIGGLLLRRKSK